MGRLDPQGEIVPKEFPNPKHPRIWHSPAKLHLQLLLAYNY